MALKLLPAQRTVVQGRWQAETIINQHLLPRAVAIVHTPNLSHGHVTLVNHNQEIVREKVQKGIRRLSFTSTIHMARIVLNAVCIAHFTQHFDIILRTLFQALGFQKLAFFLKDSQLLLQLSLNLSNRHFHVVFIGHEVSSWEDGQMVHLTQDSTCQGFNLTNPVNLISEKLYSKGMLIPRSWENLHHITTNTEFPPLKVNVIALKLDIYQIIKQLVTGNL